MQAFVTRLYEIVEETIDRFRSSGYIEFEFELDEIDFDYPVNEVILIEPIKLEVVHPLLYYE